MKKSVLALLTIGLISVSASVFAAKDPATRFAEHKQKILDRIEQRSTCVNAAQDVTQLSTCTPKRKTALNVTPEKFAEHKQKFLSRIEERRACVTAAQDKNQMKACHKKGKAEDVSAD